MSITPQNDGVVHTSNNGNGNNNGNANNNNSNNNGANAGRDFLGELQARAMIDAAESGDSEAGAVDFLGPMMRRKSIIILMALVGAGIGYLMYRRETPTYMSSLRFMLWTKNPPVIAHGEPITPAVSLPKQQILITSQTIIDRAVAKGKLTELETFKNNPFPSGMLKSMIGVKPVTNAAETLELSCRGLVAADLPSILDAVLGAYKDFLDDSSRNSGTESSQLLELLLQRTGEQRRKDEFRYNELQTILRITGEDLMSQNVNPFADRQESVERSLADRMRELKDVQVKVGEIERAEATVDPNTKIGLLHILAMKAEQFLKFGSSHNSADVNERVEIERRYLARIEDASNQIDTIDNQMTELRRDYGEKHPNILRLKSKLGEYERQRDKFQKALVDLQHEDVKIKAEAKEQSKVQGSQLSDLQRQVIELYKLSLESEFINLRSSIESLEQERNALMTNEAENRQLIAEFNLLRSKIAQKETKDDQVLDRLTALSVQSSFNTTRVEEIDRPVQGAKVSPILTNYILFSMLIGGFVGTALAILVDRADMSFRNPYEIFQKMKVPVLCKVPNISKSKVKHDFNCSPTLVTAIDPRSAAAEAFRSCRTAMLFFANHSGAKTYLVSSPSAGDGKSTTVSNLAVSLSQSGKRVCLLDCDLRRPRQHQHFGVSLKPGLIDISTGKSTLEEAIRPTFVENLSIVTSGGHPDNPGEFVVSPKFQEILSSLRDRFDIVLIDSPPLLPVADATSLSTQVDGTLLVFRIRKGVVLASTKARELLELVHAKMLGVIVNGVDQNPYYSEYGGYNYTGYSGYNYAADRYYERQVKEYAETSGEA
jgi:polysaccharide biosynthesis transport protein